MTVHEHPTFTPGPWRTEPPAHEAASGERIDIYATGEMVAACNRIPFKAAANANLIAAAPELYEALQGAGDALEKWNATTSSSEDRWRAREWAKVALAIARAALAKADGR